MSDRSVEILCGDHGVSFATFVCRHLLEGEGQGFYSADDETEEDPCPDAWCAACDRVLSENGDEWTEEAEAFAQIKVVCADCYRRIKKRNQLPPTAIE